MVKLARYLGLILYCLLISASAWAFELTLIHTSDVHSHYENVDADFGGSARHAAFFKQVRANFANVIAADTGDQCDKSPYFDFFGTDLVRRNLNMLGYDVVTPGNHEFTQGRQAFKSLVLGLNMPVLCANANLGPDEALAQKIKPWLIKEIDGRKVGFIGATTPAYNRGGDFISLYNPKPFVASAVAALQKRGVDIIVLLSHCGYDLDLEMAAEIDGLDVILGGHYHLLFANDEPAAHHAAYPMVIDTGRQKVLYSNVGEYGRYVGLLTAVFNDAGEPESWSGDSVLMDAGIIPDAKALAFMQPYKVKLNEILSAVIGTALTSLNGQTAPVLKGQSGLAALLGAALLEAGRPLGAQIAMYDSAAVGDIDIAPGPVTLGQAKSMLQSSFRLFVLEVKGDILRQTLEESLALVESARETPEHFLQFAGLRHTADMARPAGSRLLSLEVRTERGYEPVLPQNIYKVVTSGYLAGRGNAYPLFKQNHFNRKPVEKTAESALLEYINRNSPLNPLLGGGAILLNLPQN